MHYLRVKLDNGADFVVSGLMNAPDGFVILNAKGQPISFVFANEIVSITPESE